MKKNPRYESKLIEERQLSHRERKKDTKHKKSKSSKSKREREHSKRSTTVSMMGDSRHSLTEGEGRDAKSKEKNAQDCKLGGQRAESFTVKHVSKRFDDREDGEVDDKEEGVFRKADRKLKEKKASPAVDITKKITLFGKVRGGGRLRIPPPPANCKVEVSSSTHTLSTSRGAECRAQRLEALAAAARIAAQSALAKKQEGSKELQASPSGIDIPEVVSTSTMVSYAAAASFNTPSATSSSTPVSTFSTSSYVMNTTYAAREYAQNQTSTVAESWTNQSYLDSSQYSGSYIPTAPPPQWDPYGGYSGSYSQPHFSMGFIPPPPWMYGMTFPRAPPPPNAWYSECEQGYYDTKAQPTMNYMGYYDYGGVSTADTDVTTSTVSGTAIAATSEVAWTESSNVESCNMISAPGAISTNGVSYLDIEGTLVPETIMTTCAANIPAVDASAAVIPVADASAAAIPVADASAAVIPVADASAAVIPVADASAAVIPVADAFAADIHVAVASATDIPLVHASATDTTVDISVMAVCDTDVGASGIVPVMTDHSVAFSLYPLADSCVSSLVRSENYLSSMSEPILHSASSSLLEVTSVDSQRDAIPKASFIYSDATCVSASPSADLDVYTTSFESTGNDVDTLDAAIFETSGDSSRTLIPFSEAAIESGEASNVLK